MADYTGKNIFEKIGAFIPGYKGYSEKEGRRDTDKLLRLEIAKQLDRLKELMGLYHNIVYLKNIITS